MCIRDRPDEPRLPSAENILATAAMGVALTEAAQNGVAGASGDAPSKDDDTKDDTAEDDTATAGVTEDIVPGDGAAPRDADGDAQGGETEPGQGDDPATREPARESGAEGQPQEVEVIEARQGPDAPDGDAAAVADTSADEVAIILPPAELVVIEGTPSVGEAPPAIDEIVLPPKQPEAAPPSETAQPDVAAGASASDAESDTEPAGKLPDENDGAPAGEPEPKS